MDHIALTISKTFTQIKVLAVTSPIKTALTAVAGVALSFVAPVWPFILLLLGLTTADVITGVRAAKVRGERISSGRMKEKGYSFLMYLILILCAHGVALTFFDGVPVAESITYVVSLFLSGVEFKSIAENVYSSTGVDVWDKVRGLFGK